MDRIGRRPIMLLGAAVQTIMFAALALSSSAWMSYLYFIGVSLGSALYSPPSSAMVADLVPKKERRHVFATFMTANNFGAVLGLVLPIGVFSLLLLFSLISMALYLYLFKIYEKRSGFVDEICGHRA
ncbi:MFS transporter [Sporolactobacillus sp. STCC-11]|uniref:MFS transporter n=1 Tax=Sporolactobacillus caesalpiniae TaxID=3230362 RepID=UPI003395EC0E